MWDEDASGKTVQKHVFTHFVRLDTLKKSIELLQKTAAVVDEFYAGTLTSEACEKIADSGEYYGETLIAKSTFLKVIVDGNYVESFEIDRAENDITQNSIITIYQTGLRQRNYCQNSEYKSWMIELLMGQHSVKTDEAKLLYNNASYLVAMSLTDFAEINRDDITDEIEKWDEEEELIPKR